MGKIFLKIIWAIGIWAFVPFLSLAQTVPDIEWEKTVALRDLFDRSYDENVLKLFDTAVDESKNEIYVSGIMTAHMAVLDGTSDAVLRTRDTGITDYNIKYLQCDDSTRSLYLYNFSDFILYRYSLDDESAAPASIAVDTGMNIASDSKRNLLYRTSPTPPFLFFHDPITLATEEISCPAASDLREGAGPIIVDEETDRLYILLMMREDGPYQIVEINTTDFTTVKTIDLDIPVTLNPIDFARDEEGNFYVTTERAIYSLSPLGIQMAKKSFPVGMEYEDFAFYTDKQEAYVLFLEEPSEGRVEGIGNLLFKYGGSRLVEGGSVSFGRKAHRMTMNQLTGRLYIPNADAATLWIVDTAAMTVSSQRIGDSIEQIVAGSSGSPLYMNSRLGGSYLVSYDPDADTAEEFTAGTWPIPIRRADDGNRLYVSNAWDGTISVFQTGSEPVLQGTIDLDTPPGSTDRIPEMAIDDTNNLAYAAYPEHREMAIANLSTYEAAGTIDISDLCDSSAGGGQGEVRLYVVEEHNRLFAFSYSKRLLAVYETSASGAILSSTISFDVPAMKWQRMSNASALNWFFYDSIEDRLFLGPFILNPVSGNWTGETLPVATRIFYRDDERDVYWATGLEKEGGVSYNMLYLIGITDHTPCFSLQLREADSAKPDFYFDPIRNRLYVGYLMAAELDVYAVDSGEGGLPIGDGIAIDLPSLSTGSIKDTLALNVKFPGRARFADGAPIVVFAIGGTSAGTLSSTLFPFVEDVAVITFLHPGGKEGVRTSAGVYDYRGPNCLMALRDVILYAAGVLKDSEGRSIDDISPVPLLHNNVGLLGSSNGGNIVVAVAAQYGADFKDYLKYIIQWESPVCSQFAVTDLGGFQIRSAGASDYWRVVNPRYTAYGATEVEIDYNGLLFRPADPVHTVFIDGNGDKMYTETILEPTPSITPDLNGDGSLSLDEDFPLSSYEDGTKEYYSRQATYAFRDQGIFLTWPTNIATPEEADAFWDLREAVRLYESAFNNIPTLEGMVLGSQIDHVQTAPDHPHLRQAFEGWDSRGKWVQLNPDRSYMAEVKPYMAMRTDLPNPSPNTPPPDWTNVALYCMPEDITDGLYQMAAVLQMADRAYAASGTAVSDWMKY